MFNTNHHTLRCISRIEKRPTQKLKFNLINMKGYLTAQVLPEVNTIQGPQHPSTSTH